jgi:hypothetical protein
MRACEGLWCRVLVDECEAARHPAWEVWAISWTPALVTGTPNAANAYTLRRGLEILAGQAQAKNLFQLRFGRLAGVRPEWVNAGGEKHLLLQPPGHGHGPAGGRPRRAQARETRRHRQTRPHTQLAP